MRRDRCRSHQDIDVRYKIRKPGRHEQSDQCLCKTCAFAKQYRRFTQAIIVAKPVLKLKNFSVPGVVVAGETIPISDLPRQHSMQIRVCPNVLSLKLYFHACLGRHGLSLDRAGFGETESLAGGENMRRHASCSYLVCSKSLNYIQMIALVN